MANWVKLFGPKLINNQEKEFDTAQELEGKYVLIYFSAHWCPPCRQFTPQLVKTYQALESKNLPFEIIFNSWDKSEEQFLDYFAQMPWKSFPPSPDIRKELDKKYKVNGIPTLIVLDKNGEIISKDGRSAVMRDANGENFPWYPKKVLEILGETLYNKDKVQVSVAEQLKGKMFGILLGGQWVGQKYLTFQKHLVSHLEKIKATGKDFKIVFASLDRTERDFNESLSSFPPETLLTFEYKDSRVEELTESLGVSQLPNFTVIGENGLILNSEAYMYALLDTTGEQFPWTPRPVLPIALASNNDLNSSISVIGFLPDNSEQFESFKRFGEEYFAAFQRGENEEVKFFYTDGTGDLSDRLKQVFKVSSFPSILYLSLPKFYCSDDFAALESNLRDIVAGSFAGMSSL